jgi:NADH:ubiquinone oxidoreductase subunit 6 (subunit J)
LAIVVSLALAVAGSSLASYTKLQNPSTFLQIGQLLSTSYSPVLEVLALVLAASIIGALTLSRSDKEEPEQ